MLDVSCPLVVPGTVTSTLVGKVLGSNRAVLLDTVHDGVKAFAVPAS